MNLKATGQIQRVPCGDGLALHISKTGVKSWYLRYDTISADAKRKQHIVSIGEFPAMGLKEARARADEKKALAKESNVNLADVHKQERIAKAMPEIMYTFQSVAEDWLKLRSVEWVQKSAKQNRGRLAANVFPFIGHIDIEKITVSDVENCLNSVIERGSIEVARRVHTLIVLVMKYALSKDILKVPDIIVRLTWYKEQMPKRAKKSLYSDEMSIEEIGKLLLSIEETKLRWTKPVSVALQLAPYVALRPSELIEAKWSEIDFDKEEWIIPAERMKVKLPHLVPLSKQAVALLKDIYSFSKNNEFVFPSTSSIGKGTSISTMALIQAFRRMGYNSENNNRFVTHGFRGMFSTVAYNILKAGTLEIETQLAHSEKDKIKAAYHKKSLRTAIDERRELLQKYADYLDELRKLARDAA